MNKENAMKLQERIAMEAIALMVLGGEAVDTHRHEASIPLIGSAWGLSAEATLRQLDLVQRERAAVRSLDAGGEAEHVLKDEDILQNATGLEILALTKGLFETAVRLDSQEGRQMLLDLAEELEEALCLDEWIIKAEGEKDTPPQIEMSGEAEKGPAA